MIMMKFKRGLRRAFEAMGEQLEGELAMDRLTRAVYSVDASAYREMPMAVVMPKGHRDIEILVGFAREKGLSIIPRGAGTSLAGQVVGDGIVVDMSKYMNNILEINAKEKWVRVEPGVVLDKLNNQLREHGLFFSPETSTSNRCTIGGMVGNNSCGARSLVYGSTRDHLISSRIVLPNSQTIELGPLTEEEFHKKRKDNTAEADIYNYLWERYKDEALIEEVLGEYPEEEIRRRNNGYALDEVLNTNIFNNSSNKIFNLSKLFAGSEGTLGIGVEFTLNLTPLPPDNKAIIAAHFNSLKECFDANLSVLKHSPNAIELMDNNILEAASRNISQKRNMFFISGSPKAVLIIEICEETMEEVESKMDDIINNLKVDNLGYAYTKVYKEDMKKVWELRKAGLGLLNNIPGSRKPVSVIEDTAVSPSKLSSYIQDLNAILDNHGLDCVYHAHISTGELHLRPVLDLKNKADINIFREISIEVARLVKAYGGSLSGEHGDGRLRGEFIPIMYGEKVYGLMQELKEVWDEGNVFNRGKIINTPPMNTRLRYDYKGSKKSDETYNRPDSIISNKSFKTYYDFSNQKDFLSSIEQCNGSGDCRKGIEFLNTMCPSYRASGDERFTPRARANALREYLSYPDKDNPFDSKDLYWILDNCLSCKACKSECPSNVDIAKLKSEFLQHYYDANGMPLRVWLINNLNLFQRLTPPSIYNYLITNKYSSKLLKTILGFSLQRTLPQLSSQSLRKMFRDLDAGININNNLNNKPNSQKLYFFADEFTSYQDAKIGIMAIELLMRLGYEIEIPPIRDSGRIAMSKGWVRRAKRIANYNTKKLKPLISDTSPLIGIEPSTILSFRDEYPSLVKDYNIGGYALTIDEFLVRELEAGRIDSSLFTKEEKAIHIHAHCQQKALIGCNSLEKALSIPTNYTTHLIPSGCCGMAGSFGYEKDNYETSRAIGEQVLFPYIRSLEQGDIIVASGTSCREHITHFTGKDILHPVEVLLDAIL